MKFSIQKSRSHLLLATVMEAKFSQLSVTGSYLSRMLVSPDSSLPPTKINLSLEYFSSVVNISRYTNGCLLFPFPLRYPFYKVNIQPVERHRRHGFDTSHDWCFIIKGTSFFFQFLGHFQRQTIHTDGGIDICLYFG